MTNITQSLKVVVLAIVLSFGISYVFAWAPPTVAPTGGNDSMAPLNTSLLPQTKSGNLTLNALGITNTSAGALNVLGGGYFGGAISATTGTFSGRLNVGEASNAYSYITMYDDESPNGVKYIHANSNNIGFLSGAGSWLTRWDDSGNQFNTGGGYFGGNLDVNGQIKSRSGGFVFPDGTIQVSAAAAAFSAIPDLYLQPTRQCNNCAVDDICPAGYVMIGIRHSTNSWYESHLICSRVKN